MLKTNLTRRKFLSISAGLSMGLPLVGCSSQRNRSNYKEQVKMNMIRNQPPDVEKMANPTKLDELAQEFLQMIEEGLHPGAQLAVFRNGELMIELAGGFHAPEGEPVTTDTLYQMRSTTKALAAMTMLMLYDRGLFSFDDPVAKHWPEFADNGKETITIAQVMSHSAGIPDGPMIGARGMGNREVIATAVEAMEPIWEPGTANGYHAASYGWILNELVTRWDGRNISQFIADEVVHKLGISDIYIGLPKKQFPRMAKMIVEEGVRARQAMRARFSDFLNSPEGMSLPMAWVSGIATARDLANLMNVLAYEGTFAGHTFFKKDTQALATQPQNEPDAVDRRLQGKIRWGLGFMLGSTPKMCGDMPRPRNVGHAGGSATIAWADPEKRLTLAFLSNRMIDMRTAFDRYRRIANKVYESII